MQSLSDAQLLRDYVERRSEAAFAEIVRRHTDLVYSAAYRQVESPDSARDVTQNVFIDLVRKSKSLTTGLNENASLAGWLYRATRFAALNVRRGEHRRQSRERLAMEQLSSVFETSDWERIRPILDEAMSELADDDREAVLLRFFKNHDFRAMGVALGVSDDAAQKRVSRALEKLRENLSRRGVTTAAGALTIILAANAVQAAPAGLAATIASAALLAGTTIATTTTATITKVIAMTTLQKTIVAATIIAAVGTGIYETHQVSTLRDQVQTFQEQIQALHQQQAPLNEQIKQLQYERDDAAKQLAIVQAENEQWKASQKVAQLPKSQGEAGRRLEQSVSAEGGSSAPSTGMAKLMSDPKMKEYIHQVQLAKIKERYGSLFQELKLTPEETEKFTELIGNEWLNGTDMGALLTQGKADPVATRQAMAKTYEENEDQLQSLLGPPAYARYKEYNEEVPAQTTVNLLSTHLGDNPLTDDQSARLFQIVRAEPYSSTHGIAGDLDSAFFGSQEDIDKHFQQVAESNQRILDQAAAFLTPQQLAALAALQSSSINAQKLQGAALAQKH